MNNPPLCKKIVKSGSLVEFIEYRLPPPRSSSSSKKLIKSTASQRVFDAERLSLERAKRTFNRLIYSNWDAHKEKTKFLTLTFNKDLATSDLRTAYKYFNYRMKLLERHFKIDLKYICVAEPHKSGDLHFHLILFNFPFFHKVYARIRSVWGEGNRIDLKVCSQYKVNDPLSAVKYMSKYMGKELGKTLPKGSKRYSASHNLNKPIVCRDEVACEYVLASVMPYKVDDNHFSTPTGFVHYVRFSIPLDLYRFVYISPIVIPYFFPVDIPASVTKDMVKKLEMKRQNDTSLKAVSFEGLFARQGKLNFLI